MFSLLVKHKDSILKWKIEIQVLIGKVIEFIAPPRASFQTKKGINKIIGRNKHILRKCETSNLLREDLFYREYYHQNGWRKVYPYHDIMLINARQRWSGKTIVSALTHQFRSDSQDLLIKEIQDGKVLVNNQRTTIDYKVKQEDVIGIWSHIHERPVIYNPIEIIEDSQDVLVVNKPASMPVHPCGNYAYNSVKNILEHEYGYNQLFVPYRLDRNTTGVLILAKSSKITAKFMSDIRLRKVEKEYLAHVEGKFPSGIVTCEVPLYRLQTKGRMPTLQITCPAYKGQKGVTTKTVFERVSFNGKTSIVKCKPFTGRTHQIRVHLQYLGHPIVNDRFYNSPAFCDKYGQGGHYDIPLLEIVNEIRKYENVGQFEGGPDPLYETRLIEIERQRENSLKWSLPNVRTSCSQYVKDLKYVYLKNTGKRIIPEEFDELKWIPDPVCVECKTKFIDPNPEDMRLDLHAYRYSGPDWSYSTSIPEWAK